MALVVKGFAAGTALAALAGSGLLRGREEVLPGRSFGEGRFSRPSVGPGVLLGFGEGADPWLGWSRSRSPPAASLGCRTPTGLGGPGATRPASPLPQRPVPRGCHRHRGFVSKGSLFPSFPLHGFFISFWLGIRHVLTEQTFCCPPNPPLRRGATSSLCRCPEPARGRDSPPRGQ